MDRDQVSIPDGQDAQSDSVTDWHGWQEDAVPLWEYHKIAFCDCPNAKLSREPVEDCLSHKLNHNLEELQRDPDDRLGV